MDKINGAQHSVYIMRVSEQFASSKLAGKVVTLDNELATNSRTLHTLNVGGNVKNCYYGEKS